MKRPVITRLILFCEEPEYSGSSYFYGTVDYNVKNLKNHYFTLYVHFYLDKVNMKNPGKTKDLLINSVDRKSGFDSSDSLRE